MANLIIPFSFYLTRYSENIISQSINSKSQKCRLSVNNSCVGSITA
uniref:Uncharacterized protein n=1 Tax=Arundo donax TaxID=35708 RepID=A0A0A9BM46_ARUDO